MSNRCRLNKNLQRASLPTPQHFLLSRTDRSGKTHKRQVMRGFLQGRIINLLFSDELFSECEKICESQRQISDNYTKRLARYLLQGRGKSTRRRLPRRSEKLFFKRANPAATSSLLRNDWNDSRPIWKTPRVLQQKRSCFIPFLFFKERPSQSLAKNTRIRLEHNFHLLTLNSNPKHPAFPFTTVSV